MNKNVKTALIVALCLVGAGVGFCIVGRALGGSLNGARLWHSPFHSTVRVGDTGVTVGGDGGVKVDGNDVSVGGPWGVNVDGNDVSVGGPWGVNVDGDGVTIGGMHFGSDADFEDDHDDSRDSVSVDAADYRELGGAYSADGSYAVDAAGIEKLDLKWYAGAAVIRVGGDKIAFSETADVSLSQSTALRWEARSGTLYIQYCGRDASSRLPEKRLTLTVPAALAEQLTELDFASGSGDLDVSGLQVGKLAFSSGSGSLKAVLNADSAELHAASGDLNFDGACAALEAHSVSGDVDCRGSFDRLDAKTTSGDLNAACSVCPETLAFATVSGDGVLTVPKSSGFTLSFSAVSGKFDCDFPMRRSGGSYLVGDGKADFTMSCVSGDMEIRSK